jgi:hypothetical protein
VVERLGKNVEGKKERERERTSLSEVIIIAEKSRVGSAPSGKKANTDILKSNNAKRRRS